MPADIEKTPEEVFAIYDQEMYELSYADHNWNSYRRLLSRCIRKGTPGLILDIGCGLGFFVECCHKFGLPCIGLKGSSFAVETATKREPQLDIRQHNLKDPFPFEKGTFSMVVCNQVIEHLPKKTARNALEESFRVLRNGCSLFVYSPSVSNRKQAQDPTHINLHSPTSIKKELIPVGFSQVKHLNSPLKFRGGKRNPLNHLVRAFFTLFPLPFLSASASCIATKISTEEP